MNWLRRQLHRWRVKRLARKNAASLALLVPAGYTLDLEASRPGMLYLRHRDGGVDLWLC